MNYPAIVRISQIARLLTTEEVEKVHEEVYNKLRQDLKDKELWDIFLNGTSSQWEQVQQEIQLRIEEEQNRKAGEATTRSEKRWTNSKSQGSPGTSRCHPGFRI